MLDLLEQFITEAKADEIEACCLEGILNNLLQISLDLSDDLRRTNKLIEIIDSQLMYNE